ncbi:MAG: beta-galactosidase [Anaerolineae bacterium]
MFLHKLASVIEFHPAKADYSQPTQASRFGINMQMELHGWNEAEMAMAADVCARMGIRWSREEFSWNHIMPAPGKFKWERIDQAVNLTLSAGLQIMGLFAYWAGEWGSQGPLPGWTHAYEPGGVADYCDLVRACVRRYKDRIHVWQIWNEPNGRTDPLTGREILRGFWKGTPQQYAELLKAAYRTCKQEDPDCQVVGFNCALCDTEWLELLFQQGALEYADIVSFHPYRWLQQPEDQADPLLARWFGQEHPLAHSDLVDEVQAVQRLIRQYSDTPKHVWVSESSYHSGLNTASLPELDHARMYVRTHLLLLGPGGVGKVFWYDLRTPDVGLVSENFEPRWMSGAVTTLSSALSGKDFDRAYDIGEGNYAHLWHGKDEDMLALWSTCPTPQFAAVELVEPKEWDLFDMYGISWHGAHATEGISPRNYLAPLIVPLSANPHYLSSKPGNFKQINRVRDYIYILPGNFTPGIVPGDPLEVPWT